MPGELIIEPPCAIEPSNTPIITCRAVDDYAASFEDWTGRREVPTLGTNAGAEQLPFQSWLHFKESFSPEVVARAVNGSLIPVHSCIDPFGGSGTTALACQFLGIEATTIEVNPFLADVIEAKLTGYDLVSLAKDLRFIRRYVTDTNGAYTSLSSQLPSTFIEPGVNNRWIFNKVVASRIVAYRSAISMLPLEENRRFFRVVLGGILVSISNVRINGKGRRYRRNWLTLAKSAKLVDQLFSTAVQVALRDIVRFGRRRSNSHVVLRGDCKAILENRPQSDIAVFSPPYPNSFDYTDVYNLELWMLGYLSSFDDNRKLRSSTLSSHVQIKREFTQAPSQSAELIQTISRLDEKRSLLWNKSIPEMIGGYFADLIQVIQSLQKTLSNQGSVWMVVADSRYADVRIDTALIIVQLAREFGWASTRSEALRSIRSSPQQGGTLIFMKLSLYLQKSSLLHLACDNFPISRSRRIQIPSF